VKGLAIVPSPGTIFFEPKSVVAATISLHEFM
jgi:hypothetical protein